MNKQAIFCDGGLIHCNPSEIGGTYSWCLVDNETGDQIVKSTGIVLPKNACFDGITEEWEVYFKQQAESEGVRLAETIMLPYKSVTNNHTELIAMLDAMYFVDNGWAGMVYSDSENAISRVFTSECLFSNVPDDLAVMAMKVLERLGSVGSMLLNGHPTREHLLTGFGHSGLPVSIHNKWCDATCKSTGKKFQALLSAKGINIHGSRKGR